jgi:hypothetical protein
VTQEIIQQCKERRKEIENKKQKRRKELNEYKNITKVRKNRGEKEINIKNHGTSENK